MAIAEKVQIQLAKNELQLKKTGEDLTEEMTTELKKQLDNIENMLCLASLAQDNEEPLAEVGEIIALVEWLLEENK